MSILSPALLLALRNRQPLLWINDGYRSISEARQELALGKREMDQAAVRMNRFAGLLMNLFPELESSGGIIESPLLPADRLRAAMSNAGSVSGRWLIKADHALPVAGSIKARGGVYEVLVHAEELALRLGIIASVDDRLRLASSTARELFSKHSVAVGSTGNLALSIGIMAAALGFKAIVHMSSDAKAWKKESLRARGVEVIEHPGDFGSAVAAGRLQASKDCTMYFVDDENSPHLFLGYSVAALRMQVQLSKLGIQVDATRPLFVYLPCGVGGGPGGITFGLRQLFGDHVHCFFAEPVASPCKLLRLATGKHISVRDVGLDNRTEADGLAVAQASELVATLVGKLVSGVFTVPDRHLFEDLYRLKETEELRIEPSAAAAIRGPLWLLQSDSGRRYLSTNNLLTHLENATHILWTTGGSFVPDEEYHSFNERGRELTSRQRPVTLTQLRGARIGACSRTKNQNTCKNRGSAQQFGGACSNGGIGLEAYAPRLFLKRGVIAATSGVTATFVAIGHWLGWRKAGKTGHDLTIQCAGPSPKFAGIICRLLALTAVIAAGRTQLGGVTATRAKRPFLLDLRQYCNCPRVIVESITRIAARPKPAHCPSRWICHSRDARRHRHGVCTIAIHSQESRFSLHRTKADES